MSPLFNHRNSLQKNKISVRSNKTTIKSKQAMKTKTQLVRLVFTIVTFLFISPTASAHRWYLSNLPNADRIPCPDGVDCHGSSICSGFGHGNCLNGGTDRFGEDWDGSWTVNYCRRDSDGDGLTNGDEIGDPCCIWNYEDTPAVTDKNFLSHPAHGTSKHSRRSCRFDAATNPINFRNTTFNSDSITVAWDEEADSCTCTWQISVSVSGSVVTSALFVRRDQNPFTLCGLSSGTPYTISIRSENLAGLAASQESIDVVTAPDDGFTTQGCSTIHAAAPRQAGNKVWKQEPYYNILAAIVAFIAGLITYTLVNRCTSRSPRKHRVAYALTQKKLMSPASSSRARYFTRDIKELTVSHILTVLIVGALTWYFYAYSYDYVDTLIFPYGGHQPLGRALGYAAFPLLQWP